jgi:hypothetical protein
MIIVITILVVAETDENPDHTITTKICPFHSFKEYLALMSTESVV